MKSHLTPRQVAQAIGVSESSVKRWCDQGLIPTERTVGGHRRLPVSGVLQFLRSSDHSLVRPEILSLPSTPDGVSSGRNPSVELTRNQMTDALLVGDEERFRAAGFNLYLAGTSVAELCDWVLAPAFRQLGERWRHGDMEVYQERRGCEICLKLLHELGASLERPEPGAPLAIGGTFEGDWYSLPTTMAELTLKEIGWRAQSYGPSHPSEALTIAIREREPRLFWLSVSRVGSEEDFVQRFHAVYRTAEACGTALAVGGRALTEEIRRRITYSAYCDNMGHLAAFAKALAPRPSPGDDTGTGED